MPPSKFKPKRKRDPKSEALARLRAHWEKEHETAAWEPQNEPVVSPVFRSVEGGAARVVEALRLHNDEDAKAFIETFDRCTATDRSFLSLESIAFAAGIGSLRLAEVAQTALFLHGQMKTKMLLSSAMPKVMRSTIKAATDEVPIVADTLGGRVVVGKTNGDVRAMEMFHKMSGMMPLPKGAQIAIQNNFGEKDDGVPRGTLLPWKDADERLREFHEITEPKRLPSPEAKPVLIGGHIDHMQAETVEILSNE